MRISDWSSDVCSSDLDQAIACGVLCDHEPRRITCIAYATDTQTAALTQRVIHQDLMLADHAAAVIDDLTRIGLQVRGKKLAAFELADGADAGRDLLALGIGQAMW